MKIPSTKLRYLPFWLFRVKATSKYRGKKGLENDNRKKKGTIDKEYEWIVLARKGIDFPEREFKVNLEKKVSLDLTKVESHAEFLNGEMDEEEAKRITLLSIKKNQKDLVDNEVNEIEELDHDLDISEGEAFHAPIWFVTYTYYSKEYHLLFNGVDGRTILSEIPSQEFTATRYLFRSVAVAIGLIYLYLMALIIDDIEQTMAVIGIFLIILIYRLYKSSHPRFPDDKELRIHHHR